jgi:vesicle coat complex subunit
MSDTIRSSCADFILSIVLIHSRIGENFELRADLNSEYREKRKETVKKVIANMTIGKDVSSLFADVVKNMQTEDLELKKLVYLYLINYAKTNPELVILAVNTFVKVCFNFLISFGPQKHMRTIALRLLTFHFSRPRSILKMF